MEIIPVVSGTLAGASFYGMGLALMVAMRRMALADWVSGKRIEAIQTIGAGGIPAVGMRLLRGLGRAQEAFPEVRKFSERLYSLPDTWLGPAGPGSTAWLAGKQVLAAGALLLFWWLAGDFLLGSVFGAAAFFIPDLLARGRWESRQARISRELPDVLDLITMSIEAGLSLDAAFAQTGEKLKGGLLADALLKMLGEVRFGMKRHQAWREMARRLGSQDVSEVAEAMVQADLMGTGLADALRGIGGQMRVRSRQRAEESVHKAPVRLLFPLAFFIFPSVFIVLLGPVFLQLLGVLE